FAAPGFPQKVVDVHQAGTGEDSLIADPAIGLHQELKQLHLELVAGAEVSMATLACEDVMPTPIPEEASFAEPRSGSNHRLVARSVTRSFVNREQIGLLEFANAPGTRLEVIDQEGGLHLQFPRQTGRFDDPG